MNKLEYLKQLENALNGKISAAELDDIIRDYAEYFEEGKKQGKTEDEISKKLGIPFEVAQQILNADDELKQEKKNTMGKGWFEEAARAFKEHSAARQAKAAAKHTPPPRSEAAPAKKDGGFLKGVLTVAAVIVLLPIALLALLVLGCAVIGLIGLGLAAGIAGFCAWTSVSVFSVLLPPIAVAAGIVVGLLLVSIGTALFSGILLAVCSFFKWVRMKLFGAGQSEFGQTAVPMDEETSAEQVQNEPEQKGENPSC